MICLAAMGRPKSVGENDDGTNKEKKIPGWEWKTSWQVRPTSDANGDGWMYAINFSDYNDDFQGTPKPRPLIDFVVVAVGQGLGITVKHAQSRIARCVETSCQSLVVL